MDNSLYVNIKGVNIPYIIKSYKKSKHIKIYFKDGLVKITKPIRVSKAIAMKFLFENENEVYNNYLKSLAAAERKTKRWRNDDLILYKGKYYTVCREMIDKKNVKLCIDDEQMKFKIKVPKILDEDTLKKRVDTLVKSQFKKDTTEMIEGRLAYWSEAMKISYSTFHVKDTIGRYGSCIPSKRALQFSSRLIMLPKEEVDAIVVHELSHIIYKNHDKNFYELVKRYIPNYKEIDKWLKKNSNQIYI